MKYRTYQKRTVGMHSSFKTNTVIEAANFPLLFEPGTAWQYSVGVDFAGEMVSRVSGNITLEEYLEKKVWGPLGMKDMTFHPASTPSVMEKLVDMSARKCGITVFGTAEDPNAKVEHTDNRVWSLETVHCHGGGGGYGSVVEYQKLLQSLCADDGKVLKPTTVAEMFKPQLTDAARKSFEFLRTVGPTNDTFGGVPLKVRTDWGIGGMITLDAYPGRSAGTMSWGGYPNLLWWIDKAAGINGIFGTQIFQPGDPKVTSWAHEWAQEMSLKSGIKQTL
jgi:CubicO group peptidase (beta-lactamase class C family)